MVVLRCKIAVFGDQQVGMFSFINEFQYLGKTCIIKQFIERTFSTEYEMTFGCDFSVHSMIINKKIEGFIQKEDDVMQTNIIETNIFDISGSDMYKTSIPKYIENLSYLILVYDVTSQKSFESCKEWVKYCRKDEENEMSDSEKKKKQIPGMLIGNKTDLKDKVQVAFLQAKQFATQNNLEFFEISSTNYKDVLSCFKKIGNVFLKKYEDTVEFFKYLSENIS